MSTHGTIDKYTTAPARAGNTDESLTPTSCLNSMEADLIFSHECTPLEATGVLGFTELVDELERIATLQGSAKTQALQDLGQVKGLSVARLRHISAVIELYGGAA